jgi:hypothetical protein
MEIIDNINRLLGDDLKKTLVPGAKLKVAASCFSIYAYEALKAELERIDSLQFIFTAPTFVPGDAADKVRKERREFYVLPQLKAPDLGLSLRTEPGRKGCRDPFSGTHPNLRHQPQEDSQVFPRPTPDCGSILMMRHLMQ